MLHHEGHEVIRVPIGTTQQMKMSCATFKATMENPPMAAFANRAGRRTPKFLPLIAIFIREHEVQRNDYPKPFLSLVIFVVKSFMIDGGCYDEHQTLQSARLALPSAL